MRSGVGFERIFVIKQDELVTSQGTIVGDTRSVELLRRHCTSDLGVLLVNADDIRLDRMVLEDEFVIVEEGNRENTRKVVWSHRLLGNGRYGVPRRLDNQRDVQRYEEIWDNLSRKKGELVTREELYTLTLAEFARRLQSLPFHTQAARGQSEGQ